MPNYEGAVNLSSLMGETHSARRTAQLIGDWLDLSVARVWGRLQDPDAAARSSLAMEGAAMRQVGGGGGVMV